MYNEETYDPLSYAQKIVMLKNGAVEFDDIPNTKCLCCHSVSEHLIALDGTIGCCLYAKGEVCICDKFVDEDVKVIVPPKTQVLDPRLNSYVQTLSQI